MTDAGAFKGRTIRSGTENFSRRMKDTPRHRREHIASNESPVPSCLFPQCFLYVDIVRLSW